MSDTQSPDVRGKLQDDADSIRLMENPDSTEEIPTLDLGPYLAGEPGALEAAAADLHRISTTVGFFYLTGHGIPQPVIDRIFQESRKFHSLPEEVKNTAPARKIDGFNSGYRQIFQSRPQANVNIISNAKPNMHSTFSVNREGGSSGLSRSAADQTIQWNSWPEGVPNFRGAVMDYHHRVEQLGLQFLPLWAKCVGLPLNYFDQFFATPHMTLSLLHYPPQPQLGERQYGIAPHTDNSLMTFLAQSNVPGLAVQMPSGHWKLVEGRPGTLLVNTGNLLVRWTNETYLSTKHRVINTNAIDRYSIPVFFGPSGDAMIECLPTCQSETRPAKYPPSTYADLRRWYYGS